jgi:hypothetical protein
MVLVTGYVGGSFKDLTASDIEERRVSTDSQRYEGILRFFRSSVSILNNLDSHIEE